MHLKKTIIFALTAFLFCLPLHADVFKPANLSYEVCFTPGGECTQDIVEIINSAQKEILVQAYQLTSAPIAAALVNAHRRGVDVEVILDKSQKHGKRGKYSPAIFLTNQGVPTWIDYKPAIAHNKVIVIDNSIVVTGSFNFSKAAQMRNAENLLILKDINLAKAYSDNWHSRLKASERFNY